jgi:hypothetical protein
MEPRFTPRDHQRLARLGIPSAEAARHLELLAHPPPPLDLLRPVRVGDGIRRIAETEEGALLGRFAAARAAGVVLRLVPASGAATRMFRDLVEDLEHGAAGPPPPPVARFLAELPRFAFYPQLARLAAEHGIDLAAGARDGDRAALLGLLLSPHGLGYGTAPKGLIPFHHTDRGPRTALAEHLAEAADGYRDRHGRCRLELTVAPDHGAAFRAHLAEVGPVLEDVLGATFDVTFSHQDPATDTLAADLDGRPFRDAHGELLLRPGGHGALLPNLARLGTVGVQVVLIKNIDNVLPDRRRAAAVRWDQLLTGLAFALQDRVHDLLRRLEEDPGDTGVQAEAASFLGSELGRTVPAGGAGTTSRGQRLLDLLNRPLRVCGMVPNQGEAGGGPFWVDYGGEPTLQIVEGSQVPPEQRDLLTASTHFNPVDLVCALTDHHGRPYDLERFVDPRAVVITERSYQGRPLRALERPGLWNGAMAGWNTVFVEIPVETFAPVKTVLDLLRPEHQ